MDFQQLFSMQQKLNDRIVNKHKLHSKELYLEHLFALLVEIGELANETRCFKYWSLKPPSPSHIILEEYVDGLHFILSIGLDLGVSKYNFNDKGTNVDSSLLEEFLYIYKLISLLQENRNINLYDDLISSYISLGRMLGFKEDEIVSGYYEKNKINHLRQENGY